MNDELKQLVLHSSFIIPHSSFFSEAPDPEAADDEGGQNDERLEQEGDHIVGAMTCVVETVDAEERGDECDEPVGPCGRGERGGESAQAPRAVMQELKTPSRNDQPQPAEQRIQV